MSSDSDPPEPPRTPSPMTAFSATGWALCSTFLFFMTGLILAALRPGSERDRRLEAIIGNIRKASQVGVKVITHHWTVIPIRRNARQAGRGGVTYAAFKLEDNWKDLPTEKSGRVSSEDYWERITTFLQKVIPVCKQYDVRMACHPYDPPGLPFGYQGADNWDSPSVFEAIKRYESVVDSPYNGFQLCLGTTAEGLKKPKSDCCPSSSTWATAARFARSTCATSAGDCIIQRYVG